MVPFCNARPKRLYNTQHPYTALNDTISRQNTAHRPRHRQELLSFDVYECLIEHKVYKHVWKSNRQLDPTTLLLTVHSTLRKVNARPCSQPTTCFVQPARGLFVNLQATFWPSRSQCEQPALPANPYGTHKRRGTPAIQTGWPVQGSA